MRPPPVTVRPPARAPPYAWPKIIAAIFTAMVRPVPFFDCTVGIMGGKKCAAAKGVRGRGRPIYYVRGEQHYIRGGQHSIRSGQHSIRGGQHSIKGGQHHIRGVAASYNGYTAQFGAAVTAVTAYSRAQSNGRAAPSAHTRHGAHFPASARHFHYIKSTYLNAVTANSQRLSRYGRNNSVICNVFTAKRHKKAPIKKKLINILRRLDRKYLSLPPKLLTLLPHLQSHRHILR